MAKSHEHLKSFIENQYGANSGNYARAIKDMLVDLHYIRKAVSIAPINLHELLDSAYIIYLQEMEDEVNKEDKKIANFVSECIEKDTAFTLCEGHTLHSDIEVLVKDALKDTPFNGKVSSVTDFASFCSDGQFGASFTINTTDRRSFVAELWIRDDSIKMHFE